MGWFKRIFRRSDNTSHRYSAGNGTNRPNQFASAPVAPLNLPRAFIIYDGEEIALDPGSEYLEPLLVEETIAKGGFGSLYKVKTKQGQVMALKVLDFWEKQPMEWASLKKRFEVSFTTRNINHPNVIKYYHKGYYKGNPCVTMEYCGGGNMEEVADRFKDRNEIKRAGADLMHGLQALHVGGVIHRDIKPKNILFLDDGTLKITDFDLSAFLSNRLTNRKKVQELWYTPIFAPPEQKDPKRAFVSTVPRMDMFAAGVTLYAALSGGHFPWGSTDDYQEDPEAYYARIDRREFTSLHVYCPDLEYEWLSAIHQCLEPDLDKRLASPLSFLNLVGPVPEIVRPVTPEEEQEIVEGPKKDEEIIPKVRWKIKILDGCEEINEMIDLTEIAGNRSGESILVGRKDMLRSDNALRVSLSEFPKEPEQYWVSRKHLTLRLVGDQLFARDGQENPATGEWEKSYNGTECYNALSGTQLDINSNDFVELSVGDTLILGGTINFTLLNV